MVIPTTAVTTTEQEAAGVLAIWAPWFVLTERAAGVYAFRNRYAFCDCQLKNGSIDPFFIAMI